MAEGQKGRFGKWKRPFMDLSGCVWNCFQIGRYLCWWILIRRDFSRRFWLICWKWRWGNITGRLLRMRSGFRLRLPGWCCLVGLADDMRVYDGALNCVLYIRRKAGYVAYSVFSVWLHFQGCICFLSLSVLKKLFPQSVFLILWKIYLTKNIFRYNIENMSNCVQFAMHFEYLCSICRFWAI